MAQILFEITEERKCCKMFYYGPHDKKQTEEMIIFPGRLQKCRQLEGINVEK